MLQGAAGKTGSHRWHRAIGVVASVLAGSALAQGPAAPSGVTPAGTGIVNVAQVGFTSDGAAQRATSNAVTLIVAERLDVALARRGDAVPEIAAAPVAIPVVLTNLGSGKESFALAADSSTPTVAVRGIAIDRDGDGRFDPAIDTMLHEATPPLAPGETLTLLVIVAPAGDGVEPMATDGAMTLTARAVTGSGEAGRMVAGAGDDGGDAVVGPTGAAAAISVPFTGASPSEPTLVKAQAVRAPDGSAEPVSGAVVTYTLIARFPTRAAGAARIDDPLPAGTAFLPGTLMLDGQVLTEADDGDAGRVADGRVSVTLGEVAAAAHEVRFQVRLP